MPYLKVVAAVVLWTAAMLAGFVFVFPPLFGVTLATVTLAAFGYYYVLAVRALVPAAADGLSPVTPEEGRYRHYLVAQVWMDWMALARAVVPRVYGQADHAVRRLTKLLLSDWWGFFVFPIWAALCGGIVLAAVPVALLGAVLTALYGLVAAVGLAGWLVCVALLAGLDRLLSIRGRILQTCPHPSCYRRIGLPVYVCPRCARRHHRLVPSTAGAFRHVCECGARLPTTVALGRYRLTAHCPHCGGRLPDRIGRVRVEPVPFIGGPAAGKTTFMFLAIRALHARSREIEGHVAFVEQRHQQAYASAVAEFARGGRLAKTGPELPLATMLDVELPHAGRRILYLFDPAGELFTGAASVEALRYLDHTESLVFVLDPFALPEVQRSLTRAEREMLAATSGEEPSDEDPSDTLQRVLNDLRSRPDKGRQRRVAVVITKTDLLTRTSIGRDARTSPRAWLDSLGLGNTLRTLDQLAEEVRVFPSGLDTPISPLADLVSWLSGLTAPSRPALAPDLPPDLSEVPPALPLRDPWRPKGRPPGFVPLGYQAGRWTVLATLSLVTVTTLTFTLHTFLP
ncbi:hypothetical protein LO762_05815 [Actinocorallia sp. API 0066]|uniref:TRAFAC clade GTPase domain-containing protein n=1 Tax=Actinocorallia sp. API 0066 TaxID=2896846 RepID=UPI001E2920CA|nr:hypothetical protein [Actinocorallia sp. API 0066]MCD0448712.1 hypothetical protein [Actinocorallia sp. API 0066]